MLISILVGFALYNSNETKGAYGKYEVPIIVILAMMPCIMFLSGTINAEKILNGRNSLIVKSSSLCSKKEEDKFRYIANVADKVFSYSIADKSICIFKYDSIILIKESLTENISPEPTQLNQA